MPKEDTVKFEFANTITRINMTLDFKDLSPRKQFLTLLPFWTSITISGTTASGS